ncbi:unnamed protein product [Lactuca virosa]|uniref:Ubiquitin-like protease family profile domain-containing protein n=1 Tax=Lactuca virosa TaxID=75947 RepID=A0AAU9LGH0_9ASTR|nr:unnamed protein product [Lactuca virosa]
MACVGGLLLPSFLLLFARMREGEELRERVVGGVLIDDGRRAKWVVAMLKKGNVDSSRKTRLSSKREKANEVSQTRSKTSKKAVIEQPKVKLRVKVKTVSKKRELSDEDDSDFQIRPGSSKKPKRETKVLKKDKKVVVIKEFPSLKNRCSPGSLLGVIQGLSREQKDCVRAMGFGSLLGRKMIDVPLKIVQYVLDHFNFESLKVEFDNCEVSVDSKSVQEILGLPSGGSLLSNMEYISENNEESCMFEWKKQYENIDKLRLKQLKNELVQTSAADDNFKIIFLDLFINTFCESTSMGKCNLNPLYLIRRDTDLSSIDWCDYIVDCLVRTKKVYNPVKESSFFYGPAAYLMVQKIRFLEDILQESGGLGCGHVNEAYVEEEFQESKYNEEESGGDEVESDGEEDLCDEDEEDFDVNKVSDVEVYESKISYLSTKSFDFHYVSQKYKEPILTPVFVQVNDEDYGNDFLNDDENVEDYDQGKFSGDQGDGSGPHEGNIGKKHVEGKGDDDEDDEQGNGSGCNKEEAMNLNYVVENVTKSVGLIDSQEGTDGCLNQELVEDDVNFNLTGIDDGTVNLGEDDHKNKVISDHTVDKVIVAKKDEEGEDVEDCSNKNKDGENVEDCSNKNKDSNETPSLKNDIVPSFSLRFSQDSEGSKKSSQSQISSERMTKKKIKDRVILGKPSAGPECVILNVDVIDASPVSFAPSLGTLEGPSKHVSGKPKDINEEATSTLSFEYTHLNETAKYKVFKDSFSRSVSGDRDLKVLKDVDMVFFPVLRHKHIYLIVMNLKKRAFEVIDNGADDADFDDKYGALFKPLKKSFLKYLKEIDHVKAIEMADKNLPPICSKDVLCSMEIIFISNGGSILGVSYNLYKNIARNMKNKNLGKWGT